MKIALFILFLVSSLAQGSFLHLEKKLDKLLLKALNNKKYTGLSVLVLDNEGNRLKKHYGLRDLSKKLKPNDQTVYELGSITKSFTRLLLASQSRVKLTDKLSTYLPKGIKAPKPGGKEIRIEDLLNHMGIVYSAPCSANLDDPKKLKCFGVNLDVFDVYENVSTDELYKFVNYYAKVAKKYNYPKPGSYYSYSNVGIGLMGNFIANSYSMSFEEIFHKKVLMPLNMNSSYFELGKKENEAKVYQKDTAESEWRSKSFWSFNELKPAGALKSTIDDMEFFLKANLSPEKSALKKEILRTHELMDEQTKKHNKNVCDEITCNKYPKNIYYGWEAISIEKKDDYFFHGGRTGSSEAMMMFAKDKSVGIVVLASSKIGIMDQEKQHLPNDISLCILQALGKTKKLQSYCEKVVN